MKKVLLIGACLAMLFVSSCSILEYVEQPKETKDGHFQKYDQRVDEANTGNNQK